MFIFSLLLSRVSPSSTTTPATAISNIRPEKQAFLEEQFNSLFVYNAVIRRNIRNLLKIPEAKYVAFSEDLVFNSANTGDKIWVDVRITGIGTPMFGFTKTVQVKAEGESPLSDKVCEELQRYKFALYQYSHRKEDLMSWGQSFNDKTFRSQRIELDPENIDTRPSTAFQNTVRNNYFNNNPKDGDIALLVFKDDLLIIN